MPDFEQKVTKQTKGMGVNTLVAAERSEAALGLQNGVVNPCEFASRSRILKVRGGELMFKPRMDANARE